MLNTYQRHFDNCTNQKKKIHYAIELQFGKIMDIKHEGLLENEK